ncbi:MAG TPA: prolipoprotein diacylglyceryl transferase family protein [Gemmataceae bacterium]|jgi:prolipoprotein diacylglyceryltransferase|nr:prolipoprotein diacylglyceryl transferase family protein [Gemmataceae bacterium]
MYQVLFRIPVRAGWLPDNFPLPALVAVIILLLAAAAWFLAPRGLLNFASETWRNAAKWLAGFGVAVGLGMYIASLYWPDGIPVHGFGMMLFVAFLMCNWVAGTLATGVTFMTVASGPKAGKDFLAETYPPEERHRRALDVIQDTAVLIFVGGLVSARVTSLMYSNHPIESWLWELPRIWEGGIILYGSVFGGAIAYAGCWLYWYRRHNARLDTFKLTDIAAPTLAVGLAIGRIGCLLNGCCYGQVACADCVVAPIHFPLSAYSRYELVKHGYQTAAGFTLAEPSFPRDDAIVGKVAPDSAAERAGLQPGERIVKANDTAVRTRADLDGVLSNWPRGERELRLEVEDEDGNRRELSFAPRTIGLHPTQVYETISMFILFWVLLAYRPLQARDGQLMALFMMGYGLHRYLNELLRMDDRPEGFEKWWSVALVAAGAILFVWLFTRPARAKNG